MYVCVCNAVTERQVLAQVAEGARSLPELSATLGIATCCGRCADHACALLAAHAHPAAPDDARCVA